MSSYTTTFHGWAGFRQHVMLRSQKQRGQCTEFQLIQEIRGAHRPVSPEPDSHICYRPVGHNCWARKLNTECSIRWDLWSPHQATKAHPIIRGHWYLKNTLAKGFCFLECTSTFPYRQKMNVRCRGTNCVLPTWSVEALTSKRMGFWDEAFVGGVSNFRWGHGGGAFMMGLVSL